MNDLELDTALEHFDLPSDIDPEALIRRVITRKNQAGKVIGREIELTDGTRIPYRKTPKKRRPKSGPAAAISLNPFVRALILIHFVDSYLLLNAIRLGTVPGEGGGPAQFPRQLWSLIYVLQNAFATQEGLVQWLKMGANLRIIIKTLDSLKHTMTPADRQVYERWKLSDRKIPSRSRVCTFLKSLPNRGWNADEELMQQGLNVCRELDRFNPNRPAADMTNAIIGDGTVLKAACKTTDPITMDLNGTITHRRVDTFAMLHTEAGDEKVYGAKGVAIWSPSPDRHGTICLGFDWVDKKDPASEAAAALNLTIRAQKSLSEIGRLPANYAYDRAAGCVDQQALNAIGMYLTTRAIGDQLEPDSTSHYLNPKFIGTYTPEGDCERVYHLYAIQKELHLQVIDDSGQDTYLPLNHYFRAVVTKGKRYNYTDHTIPCQCNSGRQHTLTIPWNGWPSFNNQGKNRLNPVDKDGYLHILRYLQPHAPGTKDFELAFGIRERTEMMHSILDALLPFKILQRWGKDSKSGFVYGFLMGHNIIVRLALKGRIQSLLHPDG